MQTKQRKIKYQDPFELFKQLSDNGKNISLLLESRSLNLKYGKESVIVPDPLLKITGKNESFVIEALTPYGKKVLNQFSKSDFTYADELIKKDDKITGTVKNEPCKDATQEELIRKKNISFLFRTIKEKFSTDNEHFGLYGAFAYDFARNYYHIGNRFDKQQGEDFVFFLPREIYFLDDIRKTATHTTFFDTKNENTQGFVFKKQQGQQETDISDEKYLEQVEKTIQDIRNGRAMQCVLSRQIKTPLTKHPLKSYEKLREINPSPYSFYFTLGNNEVLYGASPELHIKVQNKEIEIRPIAGTVRRSKNPLEDAEAKIFLLTDEKERREHTMLVDLARNELYALCDPDSVHVSDLFTVEHYPNLYHLVSGVKGKLKKERDAFDALLITLPAGTLSGAPKQEAMKMIEQYEASRRGFYGGIIGYFAFNGDCNTGITIRSVHVKDNHSILRAGGGVVALSTPQGELKESKLKMAKMLEVVK